jgi:O-antigen ligase
MGIILIFLVIVVLCWQFKKSFESGLFCSIAMLASLPKHIQLELPGNLPALTVHRLIILLFLGFWLKEGFGRIRDVQFPFKYFLLCIVFTQGLSVLFAVDLVSSVKALLYFAMENVLFFFMLSKVARDANDASRLVRALCAGLFVVGILAFIEQYDGYSPMQYFPGYYDGTVMATFSHRILLGTAMAMGWPLCLYWVTVATSSKQRALAWLAALLCIGSCYFAQSRGPWIGMVLVGLTLGGLGSGKQRKRLLALGALALVVLLSNKGVQETILARTGSTFDEESAAQVSYQWRWELWRKAWNEISKSPVRMALGYGPGASEALNWEGAVSFLSYEDSFSSWDNNWAAYLLECGLLGFAVLLSFYAALIARMFKIWRFARGKQKESCTFLIAALVVFIFMQTNVQIFAPQLYFIFWTTLAAGIALERGLALNNLPKNVQEFAQPVPESA